MEIISYSPATDTIGDSVFYVEADGGSYISDYLNTYSYGARRLNSPDLHPDEMVSFAVMRNGMTWGEGQQGSYIEIPYGRSPNLPDGALRASTAAVRTV